ncbi:GPI anchored serine-threonine rich protein [Tirmania nivea]|nr:GPI anchored serine-threonine rich protein [Tirmania nivea]
MKSFAILSAVISAVAGIASAWTQPVGDPTGNPITRPSLHEQVTVGEPYTITWEPTLHLEGTVTLLLVKGSSDNVVPQYAIVEKTPNSGKYVWTPDVNLPDSTEGYGIQLIVDSTGQYQWSTQFGFSNPGMGDNTVIPTVITTSTAATEESSATNYPKTTTEESDYPTTTTETADYPMTTTTHLETTTTRAPVKNTTTTVETTTSTTTTAEAETTDYGAPSTLSTITVTPTNSTTSQSSPAPTQTGGVCKNTTSFVMVLLALAVAGFSMF